jgi:hypothetical protein
MSAGARTPTFGCEAGSGVRGFPYRFEGAIYRVCATKRNLALDDIKGADDDLKHIIEVVRDAAGQLT